jgi:hypothetical protein
MDSQSIQWAATANQQEAQLLAMMQELRMQVQELQQQRATRVRQVLPEPDHFTGRTRDWDTWSMTIRAKLRIDGDAIGSNEAQFYYVYSSLGARVQGLVLTFVQQAQANEDWKPLALLDYLERIYDDPNKAKKAGQRLIELRQGSMNIATYIPQFERVLFGAGANSWPDDAKITTLVGGLNKYTRQQIDGQLTLPTDYNGFVRMLQMLGNQFGPSYSNSNDNDNGNTMEWEGVKVMAATTAQAVTRQQRQAWRDAGKCVRCGSSKHWVSTCNQQPTRSRSSSVSSGDNKAMIRVSAVQTSRTKTTARSEHLGKDNNKVNGSDSEVESFYQPHRKGKGGVM